MFGNWFVIPGIPSGVWMNWQQIKGTVVGAWEVDAQKDDDAHRANRSNPFSHLFFSVPLLVLPPWEAVYSFFVAVFQSMELEQTKMKNVLSSWF